MEERFTGYAGYLETRYGEKTYRVSVDAGFSCPNRGEDRTRGGCSFCDSAGSRSPYLGSRDSLREQVLGGIAFLRRRYKARQFILYFQAYSGTFAPVERLREIYDYALSLADFRELIVSTRPDCLDGAKADLLSTYIRPDRDVWVELGLQSACPETLDRIGRGHGVEAFEKACGLLKARGIKTAVHVIFGLPGEGEEEVLSTVKYFSRIGMDGVKIHNLHIPRGTPLCDEFLSGELSLPCAGRHLRYVLRALELLPKETVIMRLTCDTPRDRLAFPRNFPEKGKFLAALREAFESENTRQGDFFYNSHLHEGPPVA